MTTRETIGWVVKWTCFVAFWFGVWYFTEAEWWWLIIVALCVPVWALNVWSSQYLVSYYKERRGPDKQAEALCKAGQRIEAIKLLRDRRGMALKEAKDYCDKHWPRVAS